MPMHKENLAVFSLAADLISGQTGEISKVDYVPQKTVVPAFPTAKDHYFRRGTPESMGISSSYLADFINEIASSRQANIHQLMVIRHGTVIAECSFSPYVEGIKHIEHSLSKSLTGTAIGMLIDEGRLSLDTRLVDVMKNRVSLLNAIKLKNLTIRHMLTMSSGVSFNESGAISGNDWVSGYINASLNFEPGEKFEYNSMNTYMLSAVVREITGSCMEDYLKEKLFEPLHITDYLWEKCPAGNTKGGWGLFMRPEDVAKIGYLYLNCGIWEGRQLLSKEWVDAATKKQIDTDRDDGSGYAFQMWTSSHPGFFEFNGMLEQNCLVYPDMDLIIVTNAGSRELFTLGALKKIVNSYFENGFSPAGCLPADSDGERKLRLAVKRAEERASNHTLIERGGWGNRRTSGGRSDIYEKMGRLSGKWFSLDEKSTGLMPIMMQVFHNNFTDGISEIGFEACNDADYILVAEGDKVFRIRLGFFREERCVLDFHGEFYLVSAGSDFASDEDGNMVLKIRLAFLEEACTRMMKIFFTDGCRRIRIEMSETPGEDVILGALGSITVEQDSGFLMTKFKDLGALDIFSKAVSSKIKPVMHGTLKDGEI